MKKRSFVILAVCLAICFTSLVSCYSGEFGSSADYYAALGDSSPENYKYESVIERGFVETSATPSSYFSLDRNTAGYSLMRSQLMNGMKIAADSVRLEEYVNYFDYSYPAPVAGEGLNATAYISSCPWNEAHKLLTVGIKTEEAKLEAKGGNYVFLIDVSGSMSGELPIVGNDNLETRLDLVKYSLKTLVNNLTETDSVAIVTYASGVEEKLDATYVTDANRGKILSAIDSLSTGGGTYGSAGIELAYSVAEKNICQGANNRVVLMSDGDFNIGISDEEDLKELISEKAKSGVYLSVLGVGMGNTRDDFMQTLALNGNGNYGYIDTPTEANKVFTEELNGTLYTVAKDAKAGVIFNSETVKSYRLLGYDLKHMSEEDFENSEKDAGEIGSNLSVTAIYEIELNDNVEENAPLADIELKWKDTRGANREKKLAVLNKDNGCNDTAFAACAAEFALVLRESNYAEGASLEAIAERLSGMKEYVNSDPYKAEFMNLVLIAKDLYK